MHRTIGVRQRLRCCVVQHQGWLGTRGRELLTIGNHGRGDIVPVERRLWIALSQIAQKKSWPAPQVKHHWPRREMRCDVRCEKGPESFAKALWVRPGHALRKFLVR